ncbi:MAG: hypothetical protein JO071_11450 [Deltaproteobacteria bacterium]|nr:hypothetical protein [Deltaproteobacteria bacterium]
MGIGGDTLLGGTVNGATFTVSHNELISDGRIPFRVITNRDKGNFQLEARYALHTSGEGYIVGAGFFNRLFRHGAGGKVPPPSQAGGEILRNWRAFGRVAGGGRPPPAPMERSVQISRVTVVIRRFAA